MDRKIFATSILVIFMLMVISFASAISSNTTEQINQKESPLFGIRTRRAIREKIVYFIKARFIGERMFFLPFQYGRLKVGSVFYTKVSAECWETECVEPTCQYETCDWPTCHFVKCSVTIEKPACFYFKS